MRANHQEPAPRWLLRDDQWERVKDLIPGKSGDCGATANDIGCSSKRCYGSAAPERTGEVCRRSWVMTFDVVRFARWAKHGVWDRVFAALSQDKDLEAVMLDSSVIRAHQHAVGAQKRTAGSAPRRLFPHA